LVSINGGEASGSDRLGRDARASHVNAVMTIFCNRVHENMH
jgi:hypothetical protein